MFNIAKERVKVRKSRRGRIRQKISGTKQVPRLSIRRSLNHFYGQLIDDEKRVTICASSSEIKKMKEVIKGKTKVEASFLIGKEIGELAKEKGIDKIVFDRSGYLYHGRVKSFADGVREAGIKF